MELYGSLVANEGTGGGGGGTADVPIKSISVNGQGVVRVTKIDTLIYIEFRDI